MFSIRPFINVCVRFGCGLLLVSCAGVQAPVLPVTNLTSNTAQPRDFAAHCAQLVVTEHLSPEPISQLSAMWREADSTLKTRMGAVNLPAHCEVSGTLRPRTGVNGQQYAIRFRLRLPQTWNQRFLFQGGGGTNGETGDAVGFIAPGTPTALSQGYAVVSQDSGHDNARNSAPELGGVVAFGFDPQARADYGGTSLKPVADAAKALIQKYYASAPERSYFVGCSKGGQEGMVFAQRHPEVFDGILAADPGFSLPRAAVAEAWDTQAFASLIKAPKDARAPQLLPGVFTDVQFARVRTAVLAECDADDGVKDGMTGDWGACTSARVKPKLLEQICSTGPDCLTPEQVDVLMRVYGGPQDSAGRALYATWPFDAGIGTADWRIWKIGPAQGGFPGINVAMGAPALAAIFTTPPTALGPDLSAAFTYALHFDFDRDAQKIYATNERFTRSAWDDVGARSPDLAGFQARGGKLIVPHGVSDPVFSIDDTTNWFGEVDARHDGKAATFVRVFGVPGMAHCAGGAATDQFNAFDALVAWVERGTAPDRILARASAMSPWPGRTRPLCPYPRVARYDGKGDVESAESFRCE
jgi:pimeloyl-ACP methyl ester carboxylesterase